MKKKHLKIICRFGTLVILAVFVLYMNRLSASHENEASLIIDDGNESMEVHFIDVGQGDAILVKTASSSLLIDAGENNMASTVTNYLQKQGIDKLDYIIGTHPHSDHIGGLDHVINTFGADTILMPEAVHTTKTYEDVLEAIEDKDMKITLPRVGEEYQLGPASFTILAPNSSDYSDLNDYSIGIRLVYKNSEFLLAGDVSTFSEQEMLKNGLDLSADVLKISHHGSEYSSCSEFLDEVSPSHAVISVGEDNEYGHPHEVILQALAERNISVYRTDKQQNIIFTTDGKTISVNTEPYPMN